MKTILENFKKERGVSMNKSKYKIIFFILIIFFITISIALAFPKNEEIIQEIPKEQVNSQQPVTVVEKEDKFAKIKGFVEKYNKDNGNEIATAIMENAKENNLDPKLLTLIIFIESKFNPNAYSEASGAKGLGQLTPITLKEIKNKTLYSVENPYDIKENVKATSLYLSQLSKEFKDYKSLINAYNCGPTFARHNKEISNSETKSYIKLYEKNQVHLN